MSERGCLKTVDGRYVETLLFNKFPNSSEHEFKFKRVIPQNVTQVGIIKKLIPNIITSEI